MALMCVPEVMDDGRGMRDEMNLFLFSVDGNDGHTRKLTKYCNHIAKSDSLCRSSSYSG